MLSSALGEVALPLGPPMTALDQDEANDVTIAEQLYPR
jgi:hypothetical protein